MSSSRRRASLSLDLDNEWSYLKTHGDPNWQALPSYLDLVVPRALEFCADHRVKISVFIVGQDAALPERHAVLRSIAEAGHEIGNHSFKHEPYLAQNSREEIERELGEADHAIRTATGAEIRGFRGPGYARSPVILETIARLGYDYDASTLPTFIGPLARAYYFRTSKLSAAERDRRRALFGSWRDGLEPLTIRVVSAAGRRIALIPVTTMPIFKVPIHFSYFLYLSCYAEAAGLAYFRSALTLCRATGVEPSLLLHPLDFIDGSDAPKLQFFPAMGMPASTKVRLLTAAMRHFTAHFDPTPIVDHVAAHLGPPDPGPLLAPSEISKPTTSAPAGVGT